MCDPFCEPAMGSAELDLIMETALLCHIGRTINSKSLGKVFQRKVWVRTSLMLSPALKSPRQPIPGAEQPPAGDAVDTNAFEYHFIGEIAGRGTGGNTEQRDAAAVLRNERHGATRWVPRHLQRGIDAFTPSDVENSRSKSGPSVFRVQHVVDPTRFC